MLDGGEEIIQETRGYDDVKQVTVGQKSKEAAKVIDTLDRHSTNGSRSKRGG